MQISVSQAALESEGACARCSSKGAREGGCVGYEITCSRAAAAPAVSNFFFFYLRFALLELSLCSLRPRAGYQTSATGMPMSTHPSIKLNQIHKPTKNQNQTNPSTKQKYQQIHKPIKSKTLIVMAKGFTTPPHQLKNRAKSIIRHAVVLSIRAAASVVPTLRMATVAYSVVNMSLSNK